MDDDRVIGSSGLSIGTHLAIEAIFKDVTQYDPDKRPTFINIDKYKYHIYNIQTIIRNIINSYDYKDRRNILYSTNIANTVSNEIFILNKLYESTKCKLVMFLPDYHNAIKNMNSNKKLSNSVSYLESVQFNTLCKSLNKETKSASYSNGFKLPKLDGDILITTHIPFDLISNMRLSLLETHTGKLKTKKEFNSKYHKLGTTSLSHLPFTEELLYILGDKTFIEPFNLKIRKDLLKISVDSNWTVFTNREKIFKDIQVNEELSNIIKKYKRIKYD